METCERTDCSEGLIQLGRSFHAGFLALTPDNSFNGMIRKEGDRYRSSKRDTFGMGLNSVLSVTRKKGRDTEFAANRTAFCSSVNRKF